jgi:hypothetical protein
VEPVAGAEGERRRLRDYLVDTIEPSPAGGEVHVEVISAAPEGEILRIAVRPGQSRFYAHLKEGGRWFLIRVSDRIRPLTREEIFSVAHMADAAREHAFRKILEERKRVQEAGRGLLWLALKPIREIQIDVQDPRLRDYLLDPGLTGNRRSGWNFSTFEERPLLKGRKLVTSEDDPRRVEIRRDGQLSFSVSLEALNWRRLPGEIWPPALLEYPISAVRMACEIYKGCLEPDDEVIADLALIRLHGWTLRRGSPRSFGLAKAFVEADDFLLEKPLIFSCKDVVQEPDRCGARLLERLYEAFGYSRDALPPEFNQESGRLILPE